MKNRQIPKRLSAFLMDQDGAVAIIIALLLPVLFGFAGLAVDIGHVYVVKNQLKNAADAGALSGARALVPYTGAPLAPNWIAGRDKATQTVLLNSADNKPLTDCLVEYGYWSLATSPPLRSPNIVPTATDVPAMQVTVSKTAGQNGGPVTMFLASVLGVVPADVIATSVAIIPFQGGMPAGILFPLAAAKTIVNTYWTRDPPVSFKIGEGISNGQWTSFKENKGGASYIAGLISGRNPTSLNINDIIYIQPGVQASNYGNAGSLVGKTVVIPLVDASTYNVSGPTPVLGFVAFKIEAVNQSSKYIQGHFDKDFIIDNAIVIGPPTPGTLSNPSPPMLVY